MNFGSLLTRNINISHFNVRTCILVVSRKVTPHPLSTAAQNTITSFQQTQYFEIFLALAVFFLYQTFFFVISTRVGCITTMILFLWFFFYSTCSQCKQLFTYIFQFRNYCYQLCGKKLQRMSIKSTIVYTLVGFFYSDVSLTINPV